MAFGHLFLALDHVHHEGLSRRQFEGVGDAQKGADEQDMGEGHLPRECQEGQQKGLYHAQGLAGEEDLAQVPSVQEDPGEAAKQKDGNLADEVHQSQGEGRAGDAVDEPAHGHPLHPETRQRNGLPAEVQSVVARTEGCFLSGRSLQGPGPGTAEKVYSWEGGSLSSLLLLRPSVAPRSGKKTPKTSRKPPVAGGFRGERMIVIGRSDIVHVRFFQASGHQLRRGFLPGSRLAVA